MTYIKNKRDKMATDSINIKKDNFIGLNSDETDKFIVRYKLPNFTQEKVNSLNSPVSIKEV